MTHPVDQFLKAVHAVHKPRKAVKKKSESLMGFFIRAAATRASVSSWGAPLDAFTAQAWLDLKENRRA